MKPNYKYVKCCAGCEHFEVDLEWGCYWCLTPWMKNFMGLGNLNGRSITDPHGLCDNYEPKEMEDGQTDV